MPTEFTPLASLIGGGMIGLSATLLMLTIGRTAGATGIMSGALFPASRAEGTWRLAMILGMIAAGPILAILFGVRPNVVPAIGLPQVILGGFVVGVGVSMSSGCTSGHGICGLARFSLRSLVAVLTFMGAGFVTVLLIRHVLGG